MEEDICDTTLGLAIGQGGFMAGKSRSREPDPMVKLCLWFPPCSKNEEEEEEEEEEKTLSIESEELEKLRFTKSECGVEENRFCSRKKLRLTPEQSTVLESSFRAHNTLSSIQKEELARKLGLRSRQVEVWFQNRRARTKLKQTAVDCEALKRWCESLMEENRRLRREVQELRLYADVSEIQGIRVCPSCEGINLAEDEKGGCHLGLGKRKAAVLQLCN